MARGIHPAILTQDGLAAALESLAERAPIPALIDVHLPDRLPPEVESTAWFVAREALTNVAKHAAASMVRIRAVVDGDELRLEVCDDGRGGAEAGPGGGLQGLGDRLAALGGRLTVESAPGRGTTLRAELPCG